MRLLIVVLFLLALAFVPIQAQSVCNGLPVVTFVGWPDDSHALRSGFCVLDDAGDLYYQQGLPDWNSYNTLPVYFTTRAIWQNQGVIETSAAYNNISLEGYRGAVALNGCSWVGEIISIRPNSQREWTAVIVADCAKQEHVYYHAVVVGSGIELQYELAEYFGVLDHINEYGGVGMYGFEVCTSDQPENHCLGVPVDYSEYFLEEVRFR